MTPKIDAATIQEHRALRQQQIIDAAMSLALEDGAHAVTISAVASRAKLSRSLIYEYFSSSSDLIADLVVEEMNLYTAKLRSATRNLDDPYEVLAAWISESLKYVADGRHLLVKSLNSIATPEFRRDDIIQGHRKLMSTIMPTLIRLKAHEPDLALRYLQSTIDAASVRIDSGADAAQEITAAQHYALAGLRALEDVARTEAIHRI
ncbi:AcrR Transcriptional regulator [Candidatus Nanopelagicaceae bacterium]